MTLPIFFVDKTTLPSFFVDKTTLPSFFIDSAGEDDKLDRIHHERPVGLADRLTVQPGRTLINNS